MPFNRLYSNHIIFYYAESKQMKEDITIKLPCFGIPTLSSGYFAYYIGH